MSKKEQISEEEIKKAREGMRDIALKNLKGKALVDIAASYFVDNSQGEFGEQPNSAMEMYKYFPAVNSSISFIDPKTSEKVDNLVGKLMSESRQQGKRYSGNVSEGYIMQSCAKIVQESIDRIKIQDLLNLVGSKAPVKKEFEEVYVGSLNPPISKEDYGQLSPEQQKGIQASQQVYQQLIGSYQKYLMQIKVSESLGQSAKDVAKDLEGMVCEAPEKAKK